MRREDQFQRSTARLLRHLGWLALHVPNERANRGEAIKLSGLGVLPGVSDWLILEPWEEGFGVAVELKTSAGRTSAAQKRFLAAAEARGMLCAVCRSMDEFKALLGRVRPLNGRRM